MPRFFFHISNKDIVAEDCEGVDLPDLHAALERVLDTYRQLALDPSEAHGLEFIITDSSGRVLLRVPVPERHHQSWPNAMEASAGVWRSAPQIVPQIVPEHLH